MNPSSDTRISKIELFMRMAELVAERTTCVRMGVGCIITDDALTQVLSMGYNGAARGLVNGCTSPIAGACGCVHAEANALVKAEYNTTFSQALFCTHMPCRMCAQLIVNSQVKSYYFRYNYRDESGVHVLQEGNVRVYQVGRWGLSHDPVRELVYNGPRTGMDI